jgi:2-polyprenyl-6-hydroxyphenyl methylase/3-demethylubiquinone-9 3-methyltransferase
MIRKLINGQIYLSRQFDKLLPKKYKIDGNNHFGNFIIPNYLKKDLVIYDVGGGKNPYLSLEKKRELNATVIGLDIDENELNRADKGRYNETIVADISKFKGKGDADLLFCRAVLEHVEDIESAFSSISSILKPGGMALIFVPSKNAVFARLNLILPEKIKKALLFYIFPKTQRDQGFTSYYNKCTPNEFKELANNNNLSVAKEHYYFSSAYFKFFFPIHFVWRMWVILFSTFYKQQAAETFTFIIKKTN